MIIFPYRCRINSRDTLWWPDLSSEFLRRLFFLLFPVFSCFCFFLLAWNPCTGLSDFYTKFAWSGDTMLVDMSISPDLGLRLSCVFWGVLLIVRFRMGSAKNEGTTSKPCRCSKSPNRSDCCSFIYHLATEAAGRAQQKALTRLPGLQDGGYCGLKQVLAVCIIRCIQISVGELMAKQYNWWS